MSESSSVAPGYGPKKSSKSPERGDRDCRRELGRRPSITGTMPVAPKRGFGIILISLPQARGNRGLGLHAAAALAAQDAAACAESCRPLNSRYRTRRSFGFPTCAQLHPTAISSCDESRKNTNSPIGCSSSRRNPRKPDDLCSLYLSAPSIDFY